MIDPTPLRAIALDLDDTLWPIWPTIRRAEQVLQDWLRPHAPRAAALCADREAATRIRQDVNARLAHLAHDLSALRREAIRQVLREVGEDTALADPAFEVFFAARQQVSLFDDALPALQRLAARYPLVAISNGNADVQRVGIGAYFQASVSARDCGVAKPDPRIFWAAAERLLVQPHELLHIGDDAALDVVGARRAGMPCIWLNRDRQDWAHPGEAPPTVSGLTELVDHLLA